MSSSELLEISSKNNPNLKEDVEEGINHKKSQESKENPKDIPVIPERKLNADFSLTFKEIYNIHMTEIESKTSLKRNHIYYFRNSIFLFLDWSFAKNFLIFINGILSIEMDYSRF